MTVYMVEIFDSMRFDFPVFFSIEDDEGVALKVAGQAADAYRLQGGRVTDWKIETVYDWKG